MITRTPSWSLALPLLRAEPALAQHAAKSTATMPSSPAPAGRAVVLQCDDFDTDGLDDALAVTPAGSVKLLRSAGDGSFEERAEELAVVRRERVGEEGL